MFGLTLGWWVLVISVVAYTTTAVVTDWRMKRIPNYLTIPMFALGWIYQFSFWGWPGVLDGLKGFGVGFGILFVLFAVGGSGAGDVKLMGALSVWLGVQKTLLVMVSSTFAVVVLTLAAGFWQLRSNGFRGLRRRYTSTVKPQAGEQPPVETVTQKQNRRIMAYAIPVALATWGVLAWQTNQLTKILHAKQKIEVIAPEQKPAN